MKRVVFYGSSTIEGMGVPNPERRVSSIVAKMLGWEEVNLGVSGSMVAGRDQIGHILNYDSGVIRVPDVLEARPELVVILYGSNDFGNGIPIGSETEFQEGTFYSDYDSMIRGLLGPLKPQQIVISTCQFRSDAETPNAVDCKLTDYNDVIKAIGMKYSLLVLDPYFEAEIEPQGFAKLAADEIHLNEAGCEKLAAYFITAMQHL
jgi:lysophospholipase L1-like esterase